MRGDELVDVFGEHQVADLTASLDGPEVLELDSVPELDGAVLGATTGSQQALLVG